MLRINTYYMPVISVEYDQKFFSEEKLSNMCAVIQQATAEAADETLEDSPLSARKYEFALNPAPMEVYIRISRDAIPENDAHKMLDLISKKVSEYKAAQGIADVVNIMLIPMQWELALEI